MKKFVFVVDVVVFVCFSYGVNKLKYGIEKICSMGGCSVAKNIFESLHNPLLSGLRQGNVDKNKK